MPARTSQYYELRLGPFSSTQTLPPLRARVAHDAPAIVRASDLRRDPLQHVLRARRQRVAHVPAVRLDVPGEEAVLLEAGAQPVQVVAARLWEMRARGQVCG